MTGQIDITNYSFFLKKKKIYKLKKNIGIQNPISHRIKSLLFCPSPSIHSNILFREQPIKTPHIILYLEPIHFSLVEDIIIGLGMSTLTRLGDKTTHFEREMRGEFQRKH